MDSTSQPQVVYHLASGVRIFTSDTHELRFRKGIWSYTEAIVNLENQQSKIREFFEVVAKELNQQERFSITEAIELSKLSKDEADFCCQILEDLKNQGFIATDGRPSVGSSISELLGGQLFGYEESISETGPVLFVSDTDYANRAAKEIASQIRLPLDVLEASESLEIGRMNLTDRTDALTHTVDLERASKLFLPYMCVVASFSSPKVSFLRNLNRILVQLEKPLILGLIDGPFASLLCTVAPQTGCFECFEHRMLARLEDTLVYHKFVESQRNARVSGKMDLGKIPTVHMMVAALLSEAFLYGSSKMCRLAGRCVNLYLPLLEVQVEDLLRVGYCPACGHVAKLQMDEMYTSSKEIVKEMLSRIELTQKS
jgi:thiazole/oxazole-forming peptide maturase SagC family component